MAPPQSNLHLFGGLASDDTDDEVWQSCPRLRGLTVIIDYETRLAITEAGEYNLGNNPINTYLTTWDPNFNFSSLPATETMASMPLKWGLLSSNPMYTFDDLLYVKDNFNYTLADTKSAPFNLSSTLSTYYGEGGLQFNISCDGKEEVAWIGYLINKSWWPNMGNNHSYPDPVLNLQFDGNTANLTIEGYFDATPKPTGNHTFNTVDIEAHGNVKITFLGTIDRYHSDVLVNDTSRPTWKRTVGFNNNTLNVGDKSSSTKANGAPSQQFGAWGIALGSALMSLAVVYL
ncbi:uncharacterized protein N7477_006302 [Penicillium maclennaniae]|uniref:uncharacterized protein n=1 Tax=Penicillium maclennaniae TaxID=1343394 RepID=UPI002541C44E|nr:uncharacterized protein N7477_006302 [Penicillium maclennaniae]KAJ5667732.1 hypothetical protein N7477_006302 [Penicillium maclennaniae]